MRRRAAKHPQLGDGYKTALTNFRLIASAVLTTDGALAAMAHPKPLAWELAFHFLS